MPMQRQTAMRVRIVDLVSGEWVRKEGMEPSYVITPRKETVSRAKIVGTVVSKFISEDGNFASVTIDDSTATMQGKQWKETELVTGVNPGDLVTMIGKVREYEGNIYMVPEIIRKVGPGEEALARLHVLAKLGKPAGEAESGGRPQEQKKADGDQLRKSILKTIEASEDGIKYSDLVKKAQVPEEELEGVINELLGEGICYEPTPGKIKKI
ncbi:MAG: hypothetical protein JXC85_00865 [Candidatus Aenigmarchaeota archaeon]|nr:hypothetical protein [Candidatus Aenigmarchaeota archaeon]